tara:strand:- start:428 stop:2203 length:1776 start_codon:yes stop_codon:yes gene_type:complete
MPRISSVKKKDAKKPSKNFFKNRESVALEDDTSVYEKSAELAKKIQDDKQKEINDAVKKATKDATKKTSDDSSLKKNVDDIIKKMVSDADRKQVFYDKLRNNYVTENSAENENLRNKPVTDSVTTDDKLRNSSATISDTENTAYSTSESEAVNYSNQLINNNDLNSSDDVPFKKDSTNALENKVTSENDSNTNTVTDNIGLRNSSVTEKSPLISNIRNNSVTYQPEFRNSSVTDSVTASESSVTMRNNSVTLRNPGVTDSVTKPDQLRNSSVTIHRSFYNLTGDSKKIVFYVGELCYKFGSRITPPITFSELKTQLDISSNEVVRVNIHRLIKKEIFRKLEHKTGKGGYQILEIREHVYKELVDIIQKNSVTSSVTVNSKLRNNSVTDNVTIGVTNPPSSNSSSFIYKENTTTNDEPFNPADVPGQQQLGPQFDSDWQNIDITPLASIGFTNNHLSQIFTKNELTPKQVQDSINAFAFDLNENQRGEKIKTSPLNLFMGILKGGSEYHPPKNFVSEEDRILKEQVEAEREKFEKRQQMQSELKEIKYQNWLLDLSVQDKLSILDVPERFFLKMPIEGIETGLKKHFEMKVL